MDLSALECPRAGHLFQSTERVAALARDFASDMMDEEQLLYLAAIISAHSWPANAFILEIGAYHGRTTAFMANVLRSIDCRMPILSIDPFERACPDNKNPQGSYFEYLSTIQAYGFEHCCLPLAAFSQDCAVIVPGNVAVLVVDGYHHYSTVRNDLEVYGPKVLPDGFIFVDDYRPDYPDVVRAADEFLSSNQDFEIAVKSRFVIARRKN